MHNIQIHIHKHTHTQHYIKTYIIHTHKHMHTKMQNILTIITYLQINE